MRGSPGIIMYGNFILLLCIHGVFLADDINCYLSVHFFLSTLLCRVPLEPELQVDMLGSIYVNTVDTVSTTIKVIFLKHTSSFQFQGSLKQKMVKSWWTQ